MAAKKAPLPDLSLDQLRNMLATLGVKRLLLKELAPNDNSKNQLYLSGSMEVTNILPSGNVTLDETDKGNRIMKAPLPLEWLQPDGTSAPAPYAQLILYPQYPEVRSSGFLRGTQNAPSFLLTTRMPGRLLLLGITVDRRIIGWCAGPDSQIARAIAALGTLESIGVFRRVPLEAREASSRGILLSELRRIHIRDWITSRALRVDGTFVPCASGQCVGYTLEAELGVSRNGKAEPDFEGWEVKASQVTNFARTPASKVITLMTPEPTGGMYKENGVEAFIREFGYKDQRGREDRLNFGGIHRTGEQHLTTNLTLALVGFDCAMQKITDPGGSLCLLTHSGAVAASWSFTALLQIWNRKHAQAVYVPGEVRTEPERQYRYGRVVRLAEDTNFTLFVRALAAGQVYYDPGIKLENERGPRPLVKRRSQFRIRSVDLPVLYERMSEVDVMGI
ncbi:MAG: MvaI/BcnI family restriction endonuclease [Dongiaceae bacterium]